MSRCISSCRTTWAFLVATTSPNIKGTGRSLSCASHNSATDSQIAIWCQIHLIFILHTVMQPKQSTRWAGGFQTCKLKQIQTASTMFNKCLSEPQTLKELLGKAFQRPTDVRRYRGVDSGCSSSVSNFSF